MDINKIKIINNQFCSKSFHLDSFSKSSDIIDFLV